MMVRYLRNKLVSLFSSPPAIPVEDLLLFQHLEPFLLHGAPHGSVQG